MRQPPRFAVKSQGHVTAGPEIERTDQGILELSDASFESKDSLEHLLLVLHPQGVGREKLRGASTAPPPLHFTKCKARNEIMPKT